MSLQNAIAASQRLLMLRLLLELPGYSTNTSMLDSAMAAYGHRVSRDKVEAMAAWLAEMELVTIKDLGSVKVVTLTGRGQDVASGEAEVPGVDRPRAGG